MTMIGQVRALWPRDFSDPGDQSITPPFVDASIELGMPRISGLLQPVITRCTHLTYKPVSGTYVCVERSELVPYRALTSFTLQMADPVHSNYATAPAESILPTSVIGTRGRPQATWSISEGALPTLYP